MTEHAKSESCGCQVLRKRDSHTENHNTKASPAEIRADKQTVLITLIQTNAAYVLNYTLNISREITTRPAETSNLRCVNVRACMSCVMFCVCVGLCLCLGVPVCMRVRMCAIFHPQN